MKVALIVVMSLVLAACTSTYTQQTVTAAKSQLATTGSVLVATPHDGAYGNINYSGSGSATANAVRAAFSRFSNNVQLVDDCHDISCLRSNPNNFDYYVVPKILHWEDRATEWSLRKDKIEVKISVYGREDTPIASQILNGESKLFTFGGDHPQDLLAEPISVYVTSLYH